jgi:orotidine-5'-phosphate decarboxylase
MNPLMNDYDNSDSKIIVALDFSTEAEALEIVRNLDPFLCKLKIGKELFTATGPKFIEKLAVGGYQVFLDLKFHDIPNTVYKACKAACNTGAWMVNVHASGGLKMLEAAKKGIEDSKCKTLLTAVTVLTSMDQNDLRSIGVNLDINDQIVNLAKLSFSANLDGVICSANEAKLIKDNTSSSFLTVTPGIRLKKLNMDDQQRVMTPELAIKNLADYLVIGRPITQAVNPKQTILEIITSINQAANINI